MLWIACGLMLISLLKKLILELVNKLFTANSSTYPNTYTYLIYIVIHRANLSFLKLVQVHVIHG